MSYHVSIVRTGTGQAGIRPEEIVRVFEKELGFNVQRDPTGAIEQIDGHVNGVDLLLFFDGSRLWTKNPDEAALGSMIEIAARLGEGARVRGDEGETYETVSKTYSHPDDRELLDPTPRFYLKDLSSFIFPVVAGLLLLYAIVKLAVKHFR